MVNMELLNRKDSLTGFHTKEGLGEYLSSKITSVYEKPQNLSIIILDLDNFKAINDRYGHLVGDDALRHFSMILNKALKGQHFVARYGGDEFVIVMCNTPYRESMDLIRRAKASLKKERLYTVAGDDIRVEASVGISTYPQDGKTGRQLLEAADYALYYAKRHGRNKIISSRSLRSHSIKDRAFLLAKITLIGCLILIAVVTYKGTASLRGVTFYARDIHNVILFNLHSKLHGKNYCHIELKDGTKMSGWILKETEDAFIISRARPALRSNPFKLRYSPLVRPIHVPKKKVFSSVKILKK